ncbi:hypothetical protein BASA81_008305 [Batrachochytrium salamandrivorans]|nr:hypothetical protein BASA81_008305 [Batrachochytrium salamandrivorans]
MYSFLLPELSAQRQWGGNRAFSPIRVHLCHAQLLGSSEKDEYGPLMLASMTDLGQFHTDAYLSTLGQFTEYFPTPKQREVDYELLRDKLQHFNLLPESPSGLGVEDGLEYARMVVTGTLRCCQLLTSKRVQFAANLYGGQSQAQRSCAHNGSLVNDSVLACLFLLQHYDRVLYVSLDDLHGFGLEEAFYASEQVVTLSLHSSQERTGLELDVGVGRGENTKFNLPLPSDFDSSSDRQVLLEKLVPLLQNKFSPGVLVFVCGGRREITPGVVRALKQTKLPVLVLGGTSADEELASRVYSHMIKEFNLDSNNDRSESLPVLSQRAQELESRVQSRLQ